MTSLPPCCPGFPQLRVVSLAIALGATALLGCAKEESTKPPEKVQLEPRKEVEPPPGFQGPIDPEWPPRRRTDQEVALRASRLLRQYLELPPSSRIKKPERPDVFVEEGQIGPFAYLEVIVGKFVHPDDPLPLVVLLHGRGNRPQIPDGSLEAEVPFRMLIPQAPDPLGDGFTWLAVPTKSEETQLFARSLSGRIDQLAPAILAYRRRRPTLGKPVVIGFSQGGILTYGLVTRYPNQFAAGFPIAGWLPPALYPDPANAGLFPYIFAQHGNPDPIVPTGYAEATVRQLRSRGLRVDFREAKGVGHVVTPEMADEVRRSVRRLLRAFVGSVRTR